MKSLEKVIQTISLPLELPEQTFIPVGEGVVLTIEALLANLPTELAGFTDLTKTAFCKKQGNKTRYFLPLEDSTYLEVVLERQSIIEINKLDVI